MPKSLEMARLVTVLIALAACIGIGSSSSLSASLTPRTYTGALQGAIYRIDIPAHWNGDLVMLMHGYEAAGSPQTTPMEAAFPTSVFLRQGYAVAQSNYASQGWAVGDAIVDNDRLRQHFIHTFDRPTHIYIFGVSLGGLETVASIERYQHVYSGALVMCGATVSAPEFISRDVVTPLVAFDALIPGVLPNLGAPDSPPFITTAVFTRALQSHSKQAAILEERLQGTLETLPDALTLDYTALRELEQRAGGMPVDNSKTIYHDFGDDGTFNQRVHRYIGSPAAMAYAHRNVTLTGRIDMPLVMQWNAFDPIIPARFHPIYPNQVRAAGNSHLLTVLAPVGSGHCNFSDTQVAAAFKRLVRKAGTEGQQGP